eukprot:TRINITY_DN570_c0_g1_i1.p2 TRINITY_DN570_c0_g1~~TRINITY_DN570_c0_g1_i1.p2  ORF type:complete len:431 (-),score=83.36 TRINITY_DN570_c0_g1_i1:84-1376(-)
MAPRALSVFAVVAVCIALSTAAFTVRYDGHRVLRFHIENDAQVTALSDLLETYPQLDSWSDAVRLGYVDIRVPPQFASLVDNLHIPYDVFVKDVQALIDENTSYSVNNATEAGFFDDYQTYDAHVSFLKTLANNYPSLVSMVTIGTSLEGRPIVGIRISSGGSGSRPKIIYNGCQHAREWISCATVAYIANELVTKYSSDSTVRTVVDKFDWVIVTVLNPDGYIYSFNNDRMWRKNRRVNGLCAGVDTNRNWGYQWNTGGSSNNPCSDSYHGSGPFSEPENKAMADFITSQSNVAAYIDFHAYSQLWMSPWGYTTALPRDDTIQKRLGETAVAALRKPYGTVYQVGNIANIIYVASGSSADWAYGSRGIVQSFGVELRDTGRYGFLLPANQIIPSGIETFEAAKAMANFLATSSSTAEEIHEPEAIRLAA